MSDKNDGSFDNRLARLETIIDSISITLDRIQTKLDNQGKVNWAPIAIGVTIFFTVAGSVSTIYNARISTINNAVETIDNRTVILEKYAAERGVQLQIHEERLKELEEDVDNLKRYNERDKLQN